MKKEDLKQWFFSSLHGRTITPEEVVLYKSLMRRFFNNLETPELNTELFRHLPEREEA